MSPKIILSTTHPSPTLRRASALFGLRVRHDAHTKLEREALRLVHDIPTARRLESLLAPGRVILVTGESGSGKSTLLELLTRRLRLKKKRVHVVIDPLKKRPPIARLPIIELMTGAMTRRLRTLASCGLSDATLLARQATELSEGQRARLALALATQSARPGQTLVCDEFASTLDRITAMGLSFALAKWAKRENVQVVVATGNDDIAAPLEAIVFRLEERKPPAKRAA